MVGFATAVTTTHTCPMGKPRWGARARVATACAALVMAAAACAGGGGSDETATSTSAKLASCADERHVVAFDFFGTITMQDDNLGAWLADPAGAKPPFRAGVVDVAKAYQGRGYEILYLSTAPEEITVEGRPLRAGISDLLVQNGFPLGDGATLWLWDNTHTPMRGIAAEFERLVGEGATIDAAYTDNQDKAFAFKTAVPSDGVFTVGTGSAASGVTPVPNDDMVAHAAEIAAQPPICRSA
jgi:hypothetical protein